AYMAPERFSGKFNKFSDQYSLAITYIELRTGHRPFHARENMYEAMLDATSGEPDLSKLDVNEQPIVRRALAKNPEDRFPNCIEFVDALESAIVSSAVERSKAPQKGAISSGLLFKHRGVNAGEVVHGAQKEVFSSSWPIKPAKILLYFVLFLFAVFA